LSPEGVASANWIVEVDYPRGVLERPRQRAPFIRPRSSTVLLKSMTATSAELWLPVEFIRRSWWKMPRTV
jgi:hypothetical protein